MTASMPTNKAKVGTYIDQELKEELERLAELESRSVSNFVELLIKEAVAKAKAEGKLT
ncbi:MAG TPA: ribbon-helix-helix protein, CopG family [Leptolyngbyaceae cyanobacterium]